ncbi:MAG: hypothetical protein M1608_08590, partial [Candidatus Omnitrophica bacterium]|nr:hypothetical protein [Candidatus Omnitrophota bacterium]
MKNSLCNCFNLIINSAFLFGLAGPITAAESNQNTITIVRNVDTSKLIPISLEGFSGEVLSTL